SSALARRVSRVSAFPSRTSAIRSSRMLASRKPPRIMPPTRIASRHTRKRFFAYLGNRGILISDLWLHPHRHQHVKRALGFLVLDQRRRSGVGEHEHGGLALDLGGDVEQVARVEADIERI